MKPRLFAPDETTFTTNGLGTLDFLTCYVTEERNGSFELEGTISEEVYHSEDLEMSSIIQSKVPDQDDLQLFRIYKITKPINGKYTVYAQHISYQLSYIPTLPFSVDASNTACTEALAGLVDNAVEDCPFTFTTNVTTAASFRLDKPASIRNCLGGVDGSILDQYGGEYLWNNYEISLLSARGKSAAEIDVTLRYGKDITDLQQEEYISNTITGVCPYWIDSSGSDIVTLEEGVVDSSYADNYPFKRTVPLDCSAAFDTAPSEDALRTYAQAYVNKSGIGIPTVSIKVSFISLDKDNDLERVKLCDYVGVEFTKLGITTTAKVVKYTYDVLLERYKEVEIGTISTSLATTITDQTGAITTALDKAVHATRNATAWLTGSNGYVMAVKNDDGTWKELLFLDTADASEAVNVLRINENGIGFSSTGVDGPYTQAWTLDGKMVIGGTNAPSLTVYDDDENILFQISANGMQWSSDSSSMTEAGVLTMTGATIQTSESGARILMDASSSLKGYYGDTMYNLINMEQSVSGTHQMTIDANTQLNIRTPNLYVVNQSAGTGTLTAYQTATGPYDVVSAVSKNYDSGVDLWIAASTEDEGAVYCFLPALLNVEKTTYTRYLGMTVTGATTTTIVI